MVNVVEVDTQDKAQVNQFIQLPFKLYKDCPQWVPQFNIDMRTKLNRAKHPFHAHSDVAFFLAERKGEVVGRVAAIENKPYNKYHEDTQASFYFFDTVDDQDVVNAMFERVFEWIQARGLTWIVGPKGMGPMDGYGVQVHGFEHRTMMTMMNYNYPYYPTLLENLGFEKEVDFVSAHVRRDQFKMPEKVHEIARRIEERGKYRVLRFSTKRELRAWAARIGDTYNRTFVNNWEYYPLTDWEIEFVLNDLLMIADPRLIKIIAQEDEVVGFLFAFPDCSAALQRQKGRLTPWGLIDIMRAMKRADWVAMNGAGVLPKYHGRGLNALLYAEMEKTADEYNNFIHVDMTQVAESAVQMRKDLVNLGGDFYKNHRVYKKTL
jgi:GNAT superfamily N-acetyltransferase